MNFNDIFALSLIKGIGHRTLYKLYTHGDIEEIRHMDDFQLSVFFTSKKTIDEFRIRFDDYREEALKCRKKLADDGASVLFIENSLYPEKLSHSQDMPFLLFCKGEPALLSHEKCAAISGPRKPSPEGLRRSKITAEKLTQNGLAVISGLALGIDSAAHSAALERGLTIAVLPYFEGIYPAQNRELADRILDHGGLIISDYYKNFNLKYQLLNRDKIIVNLSQSLYLPDQFSSDSGTAYTARYALSKNKAVYLCVNNKYTLLSDSVMLDSFALREESQSFSSDENYEKWTNFED